MKMSCLSFSQHACYWSRQQLPGDLTKYGHGRAVMINYTERGSDEKRQAILKPLVCPESKNDLSDNNYVLHWE